MPERSVMQIRRAVATVVKRLDRQFGFREWCRGEPRPPRGGFDLVIACSSIEHFGLAGRYGATADDDADLKAARKIHSLLAPSGRLLLTIPVGMDAVHVPWHRVYGSERLPQLIEGFTIVEARFWTKSPWQPWYETTMQHALNHPVALQRYALGQFALTKATGCGHQRLAIRNDITIPTSVRPS